MIRKAQMKHESYLSTPDPEEFMLKPQTPTGQYRLVALSASVHHGEPIVILSTAKIVVLLTRKKG